MKYLVTIFIFAVVLVSTLTNEIHVVADERPEMATSQKTTAGIRTVTAYTLGRTQETDDSPCIGAFNDNLCELAKKGIIACASNEFPKGTKLQIGEIECTVLDRMNRRYKNRIDLAMVDYQKAKEWGIKNIEIQIYE